MAAGLVGRMEIGTMDERLDTPARRRPAAQAVCWALLAHLWFAAPAALQVRPALSAEPAPPEPAAGGAAVTAELIQARLAEVAASEQLSDEQKKAVRQLYEQAAADVERAGKLAAQAAALAQLAETAEARLAELKAKLEELPAEPSIEAPPRATAAELEPLVKAAEAERDAAKQELAKWETEPARRQARRAEIPALQNAARRELEKARQQLAAPPAENEQVLVRLARRTALEARVQALEAELDGYDQELAAYAATNQLLPLERDLAARLAGLADAKVQLLRARLAEARRREAEEQAARARVEAVLADPALVRVAEDNQAIAERNRQLAPQIEQLAAQRQAAQDELDRWRAAYQETLERVEKVGLTEAIGQLLRRQLASLPDTRRYERAIAARRQTIRDVQLELLELDDQRSELADLQQAVRRKLAELGRPVAAPEDPFVEALRKLLEQRKELIDSLLRNQNSYFEELIDLDTAEQQLVDQVETYAAYIRERVLWIRSANRLRWSDLPDAAAALLWLTQPSHAADLAQALIWDVRTSAPLAAAFVLIFSYLILRRRSFRRAIVEAGEAAAKGSCRTFAPTATALLHTLLVSLPGPLLALYLGWRLQSLSEADGFAGAAGRGLVAAAAIWAFLEYFRQLSRAGGLGDAHFRWPKAVRDAVRRRIRWLSPSLAVLTFLVVSLDAPPDPAWSDSLGRLAFVAACLMTALFAHGVLRTGGAAMAALAQTGRQGGASKLRALWYAAGVGVPVALAALAWAGYYYTARQLAVCLELTLWLLLGLLLASALLTRWLLLHRRRLAIQQARERLAAKAQRGAEDGGEGAEPPPLEEPKMDLSEMNQQTRQLINVALLALGVAGVWLIWVDVLPALGFLDRVQLWRSGTGDPPAWITLKHLLLAAVALGVTILAIRNIPGMLELFVLQRSPLDAGARYAVITIFRYTLTVIGLVTACALLGIHWSDYQWLVAAATVGLGFGLQEIFANFVSGLIVLLERPIRVGDVVTVEGVTGTVSRIRMRATTVTNWDRQEYVVPNKEFVTGRLLNWTLSNPVNRIVINVGVAYGSDTEKARELLLQAAREHPLILDDPAPLATFEGFGDSTLNFVLRCYLPDMENRLSVIHELHTRIHKSFAEAGLEIAFPQRDVHIRSWPSPPGGGAAGSPG